MSSARCYRTQLGHKATSGLAASCSDAERAGKVGGRIVAGNHENTKTASNKLTIMSRPDEDIPLHSN